ncbi:hypothetical protein LXL04_029826 [Taraxacum kok-saghyz]
MCRSWNRRPEVGSAFSSFSDLPSETIPLSSSFPVRVKIDRTEKSSTVEQRRDLWVPTDKIHHRVLSSKSPKQEATVSSRSDLLLFKFELNVEASPSQQTYASHADIFPSTKPGTKANLSFDDIEVNLGDLEAEFTQAYMLTMGNKSN